MARKPRIDFPGAWHHVSNTGSRRRPLFTNDKNCQLFCDCLADAVLNMGIEVHAYALLPNQFELLVHSPLGNLSRGMKQVIGLFTQNMNRLRGWDGSVFHGRYHSQLLDDKQQLQTLMAYIHLAPVRAGVINRLDQMYWSSHRAYLGREDAPQWLRTEVLTAQLGASAKLGAFVQKLKQGQLAWPERFDLDGGWYRGTSVAVASAKQLNIKITKPSVTQLLEQVCQHTGATISELRKVQMGPHANPARRFAVWALFRSRHFRHIDIADALQMSPTQVAKVLSRMRNEPVAPLLAEWMQLWSQAHQI